MLLTDVNFNVDGDQVVFNNLEFWKIPGIYTCTGRSVSVLFSLVRCQ